jgi:antitoxin component YwqK of YwqJK toxin-antitoxin module
MSYEEIKYSDGSFQRLWRDENGKYHRELAPAIILYYSDGSISSERFFFNGFSHSELGPADIYYQPDGSIVWEEFYINGKPLGQNKKGFWALWDRLTEEQRRSTEVLKCLMRFS